MAKQQAYIRRRQAAVPPPRRTATAGRTGQAQPDDLGGLAPYLALGWADRLLNRRMA